MENFNRENMEAKTLNAIRQGDAMPLPDFLEESEEARQAFAEALSESEKLKESFSLLDPEEKLEFLTIFNESIDSLEAGQPNPLKSMLDGAWIGTLVSAALAGGYTAANSDEKYLAISSAAGALFATMKLIETLYGSIKSSTARNTIRKQISEIVTST